MIEGLKQSRFTRHIASVTADDFPDEEFWDSFTETVKSRLRRKELLFQSPSLLGYGLYHSWSEKQAVADIVFDCYVFAVIKRLNSLKQQLKVKDNVDGLILRNIDNFIFERRRKHDGLGHAVFKNLEAGVQSSVNEGTLHLTASTEVRNDTVLAFVNARANEIASAQMIEDAVKSSKTLNDNVLNLSRQRSDSRRVVVDGLNELNAMGITAFRFKDIIDPIKRLVRTRIPAANTTDQYEQEFSEEAGEVLSKIVWTVKPDTSYENQEHLMDRLERIRNAIMDLKKNENTKNRILRVFDELVAIAKEHEDIPPQAELARRLALKTSTLSDYVKEIRRLWNCVQ